MLEAMHAGAHTNFLKNITGSGYTILRTEEKVVIVYCI